MKHASLTEEMKSIIDKHKIGYVATVNNDGSPNLSPKGTMRVIGDTHIIFGNIRSPNTVRNIEQCSKLEINYLDIFSRKAVRIKGRGEIIEKSNDEFDSLFTHLAFWGALSKKIKSIVKVHIEAAELITSPSYDVGETESTLREQNKKYYSEL